jgi:hypothetical protein
VWVSSAQRHHVMLAAKCRESDLGRSSAWYTSGAALKDTKVLSVSTDIGCRHRGLDWVGHDITTEHWCSQP